MLYFVPQICVTLDGRIASVQGACEDCRQVIYF